MSFMSILLTRFHQVGAFFTLLIPLLFVSGSKAVDILQAYEGTLEDDYPPDNERCEHGEMLLYKVASLICFKFIWEIILCL